MNQILSDRIKRIEKILDTSALLNKSQDVLEIKDYYKTNKLAYLLFHNLDGYLHMGISDGDNYDKKDLEVSLHQINSAIKHYNYSNIVELGSGRGANPFYIARNNPSVFVKAVDLSTNPLAKYKRLKNLQFFYGNFHDLNFFADSSVDLIFGIETFCHSNNKDKLFSEIHRVLKPNGRLYIYDGYRSAQEYSDALLEKACVLVEHGMAVNKFDTREEVESKAIRAGLILETKENLSKNILPTMKKFERIAQRFYSHPKFARFVSYLFPEKFIRNSIAGYLMVPLFKEGVMVYYKHVFKK